MSHDEPVYPGTRWRSEATFRDEDGALTDPATVSVTWYAPDETETTWVYGIDPEVVRVSLGVYEARMVLDQVGFWREGWFGDGLATNYDQQSVASPPFP